MTIPYAPAGNPGNTPGQGAPYQVPVNLPGPTQQGDVHPTVGTMGMPPAPAPANGHPTIAGNMPPVQQPQGTFGPYAGPGTSFAPAQPQQPPQPAYPANPQYAQQVGVTAQGQPIYGQPAQQPAVQQRTALTDDTIVDGDAVPIELRGRTFRQVKQIYNALAVDWMNRQNNQPQGQPQAQPQGQPQGQAQEPGDDSEFWQNPAGYIQRAVQQAVAPVTQQAIGAQITQARDIATQGVPDFPQLESEVVAMLSNVDEQTRANPQAWVNAIDMARGRLIRSGRYLPPNGQPANGGRPGIPTTTAPVPGQYGSAPSPNGGPGMAVPATQVPLYGFFSESPTPPPPTVPQQPTVEDQFYATKFNMPLGDFMAWKATQQVRRG